MLGKRVSVNPSGYKDQRSSKLVSQKKSIKGFRVSSGV
jgi:hypothetical protein